MNLRLRRRRGRRPPGCVLVFAVTERRTDGHVATPIPRCALSWQRQKLDRFAAKLTSKNDFGIFAIFASLTLTFDLSRSKCNLRDVQTTCSSVSSRRHIARRTDMTTDNLPGRCLGSSSVSCKCTLWSYFLVWQTHSVVAFLLQTQQNIYWRPIQLDNKQKQTHQINLQTDRITRSANNDSTFSDHAAWKPAYRTRHPDLLNPSLSYIVAYFILTVSIWLLKYLGKLTQTAVSVMTI